MLHLTKLEQKERSNKPTKYTKLDTRYAYGISTTKCLVFEGPDCCLWQLPPPRETSPPPDVNRSTEYVHPCPHCVPGNPYDWRCPQPIPDPNTDPEPWHVDDGVPPGHAHCGNWWILSSIELNECRTHRYILCLVKTYLLFERLQLPGVTFV